MRYCAKVRQYGGRHPARIQNHFASRHLRALAAPTAIEVMKRAGINFLKGRMFYQKPPQGRPRLTETGSGLSYVLRTRAG